MGISEKIRSAGFSKSVAGYNTKEVDAFMKELLVNADGDEQVTVTLRAKLDAYESKRSDFARREDEVSRLLEAAKKEAGEIVTQANEQAQKLLSDAQTKAAEVRALAEQRAKEMNDETDRRCTEKNATAQKNADMILAAADKRGKILLAEAQVKAARAELSLAGITNTGKNFETQFRSLVSATEKALAALNAGVPIAAQEIDDITESVSVSAEPCESETVHTETQSDTGVAEAEEKVPDGVSDNTDEATNELTDDAAQATDYAFAGGKLLNSRGESAVRSKRKLYDTVTVTYDRNDDGFDDIKKIMDGAGEKRMKNPAHFTE